MVKKVALLIGALFLLIGVLGFIPGVTTTHADGSKYLFGVFIAGGVHNLVHLLSGVVGLWAGMTSFKYSRLYLQIFGVVYALVTVIGFIQKTTVLGLFHVNTADNFLHLALAAVILAAGFLLKDSEAAASV